MSYIKCESEIVLGANNTASCETGFINAQPDYDVLLNQLAAINDFDPLRTSGIIVFCLAIFITGFGVGMVIRWLRRF